MRDKLWMQKFKGADLQDHHRRLRETTHMVDDSSPPKLQRSTRLSRERERNLQLIQKHNRLFLERLATSVQKKNIDNDPVKKKAMSSDMAKRREQLKVQRENKHMLKRLQNAEKTYSAATWRKEEAWRQSVLKTMTDTTIGQAQSPIKRPSSSNAAVRPKSAQRTISPQIIRKKAPWLGSAIALNEQDKMHLTTDIRPLRAASPVFLRKANNSGSHLSMSANGSSSTPPIRRRPATAGASRPNSRSRTRLPPSPTSVDSDPSVVRQREMRRLFKPTGAYMSSKL